MSFVQACTEACCATITAQSTRSLHDYLLHVMPGRIQHTHACKPSTHLIGYLPHQLHWRLWHKRVLCPRLDCERYVLVIHVICRLANLCSRTQCAACSGSHAGSGGAPPARSTHGTRTAQHRDRTASERRLRGHGVLDRPETEAAKRASCTEVVPDPPALGAGTLAEQRLRSLLARSAAPSPQRCF